MTRRPARSPSPRPAAAPQGSGHDARGYRSPAFRDVPSYDHAIDYAGLPKDEEEDLAAAPPPNALPSVTLTSHEAPRRGFRRNDRTGTDPNAYRSPAFAELRDPRFRQHPATRGDIAPPKGAPESDDGEPTT